MTSRLTIPSPPSTANNRPDDLDLNGWCVAHLPECERWLVRRGLSSAARVAIGDARFQYQNMGAVDPARPPRKPNPALIDEQRATPTPEGLTAVLLHDLGPTTEALRDAGVPDIRVRTSTGTLVPLFVAGTSELVVPDWLAVSLPCALFAQTPLFPSMRRTSTTWLLFQSLLPDEGPSRTFAERFDVMDYH